MLPQVGLIFQNMKDEGFQKINNLTLIDACFFPYFCQKFQCLINSRRNNENDNGLTLGLKEE